MANFRPPKQWTLDENENISSYASWKSNIEYHLSLNIEFADFLDTSSTWEKQSVKNRGLSNDVNDKDVITKTAVQKNIQLERMLGIIAQFSPPLLRNDIIKRSLSLKWIWNRIRKYYQFEQNECNFLKISSIRRKEGERYETLYQRLVAHIEDNLLSPDSNLIHDGSVYNETEEMSPTVDRLLIYIWLNLIDERLPAYISRVYANDLKTKTVKDIQPQICDAMDSLLADINTQEEIKIQFARSSYDKQKRPQNNQFPSKNSNKNMQDSQKSCIACKTAGRTYSGHDVKSCWYLSKADRLSLAKTYQVVVDENTFEEEIKEEDLVENSTQIVASTLRIQSDISPFFYGFYNEHLCKIVLDTGATSSVISYSFAKKVGIPILPTLHAARTVDKTPLKLYGECKFSINFGQKELLVDGLIHDNSDCDILAGIPFLKLNDIDILLSKEEIRIGDVLIGYGSKSKPMNDIYRTKSVMVRNTNKSKILFPGEYFEFENSKLKEYEGDVTIEPHIDSPILGTWPPYGTTKVVQGVVRIPNNTNKAIKIEKSQHVAHIRRVYIPETNNKLCDKSIQELSPKPVLQTPKTLFSSSIDLDPDNILSDSEKKSFRDVNSMFDSVFNPQFGLYNGKSGPIVASLNIGRNEPPVKKSHLPFYNEKTMHSLQQEADELERLGVLERPENLGIQVKFASPSFLKKKPNGTNRFVTAFNDLGPYIRILPTVPPDHKEVLRKLSCAKYMAKTDMTKSFFQIPLSRDSIPYLATATPFKGLRVYTRSAMGMPGASEHLSELISRVLGDFCQEGFLVHCHDDIYIVGNAVSELLSNWTKFLARMKENNLSLSSSKTVIAPISTTVLGWIWKAGTLQVDPHKISPLSCANLPRTCTAMKSFIGAIKAISRTIKMCASYLSPLENAIKALKGAEVISWNDELIQHFRKAQQILQSRKILTIPKKTDKLTITVDASPLNQGIGATLFVTRDGQKHLAEFFSMKMKDYHLKNWQPCEMEGLAIASAAEYFSYYIRESAYETQILTDNKPCAEAFRKLRMGKFSASARISSFLSTLSQYPITITHLKGSNNITSDYLSRNPVICSERSCQICKFVYETADAVVQAVTLDEVISGRAKIPFLNFNAWRSTQHECGTLRKVYAHLSNGTRPSKKAKNIRNVKRYLNITSIDENGVLVVRKSDPFVHQRKLIVVPTNILPGLITSLHIQFNHATSLQIKKIFDRYFYCTNSKDTTKNIIANCIHCNSVLKMPREMFTQSSTDSPTTPGQSFAADVIKRNKQCIFACRDTFSSFTTACIINGETSEDLLQGIFKCTTLLRCSRTVIRVDNAPGFIGLKNSTMLTSEGIYLDFGRVKNINRNPVVEKCNQELEEEMLKVDPTGGAISEILLIKSLKILNSRIRFRNLSAAEIVFNRDQLTGQSLNINNSELAKLQSEVREANHIYSSKSKASGAPPAKVDTIVPGDLVYLKSERNKNKRRDLYITVSINSEMCKIQKMVNGKFFSTQYDVPLCHLYLANPKHKSFQCENFSSDSSSDSDTDNSSVEDHDIGQNKQNTDSSSDEDHDIAQNKQNILPITEPHNSSIRTEANLAENERPTRPIRHREKPKWFRSDEWDTPTNS